MKIAVDAMGGDIGPSVVVKGSIEALQHKDLFIYLIGNKEEIEHELKKYKYDPSLLEVIHTTEIVGMNDDPLKTLRNKPKSSLALSLKLVREKKADGVISAGSTGAFMALAIIILGRVKGVLRPAIAVTLPSLEEPFLFLDAGANTDCKPIHLYQFALMGKIYSNKIFKKKNPRVALFNIGEEVYKGDKLTVETHKIFDNSEHINFVGNVEGHSMFSGNHDVLVCDGFVGNITIKSLEGILETLITLGKNAIKKNFIAKLSALILKPTLMKIKQDIDSSEIGGAPLLGVNGNCIVAHGGSTFMGIKNAILTAVKRVESNINENIKQEMIKTDLGDK